MECQQYHSMISRYLDDDLSGPELDLLLHHLPGCAACRTELRTQETMRSWFAAAAAADPVPEAKQEFSLRKLLSLEEGEKLGSARFSAALASRGNQAPVPKAKGEAANGVWKERLSLLFSSGSTRDFWRYALPLVVVGLLAFWFYPGRSSQEIDVRQLASGLTLPGEAVFQNDLPDPHLELYLIQHVAQRPWAPYGEEIPMIRQASAETAR